MAERIFYLTHLKFAVLIVLQGTVPNQTVQNRVRRNFSVAEVMTNRAATEVER
jgi:hypothetical protein